jgi:hypothetical protein
LKSGTGVSIRARRVYLKTVTDFDEREFVKCDLRGASRGKLPKRAGQRAQAVAVTVDQQRVTRLEV